MSFFIIVFKVCINMYKHVYIPFVSIFVSSFYKSGMIGRLFFTFLFYLVSWIFFFPYMHKYIHLVLLNGCIVDNYQFPSLLQYLRIFFFLVSFLTTVNISLNGGITRSLQNCITWFFLSYFWFREVLKSNGRVTDDVINILRNTN